MKKGSFPFSNRGDGQQFSLNQFNLDEIMKDLGPKEAVDVELFIPAPNTPEGRIARLERLYKLELAASKKESAELTQRVLSLEHQVSELQRRLENAHIPEISGTSPKCK